MKIKILIFTVLFALFITNVKSQKRIEVSENFSYSSKHTVISYYKENKSHSLSYGISVINSKRVYLGIEKYDLRQKYTPQKINEYFGLDLTYRYFRNLSNPYVKLFAWYNIQTNYSSMTTKILEYKTSYFDTYKNDTFDIYAVYYQKYKPSLCIEQNFGLGIDLKLYKKIFLDLEYGLGMASFFNLDERLGYLNNSAFRFSTQFSFGLAYQFE